jgi:hypothetical protein
MFASRREKEHLIVAFLQLRGSPVEIEPRTTHYEIFRVRFENCAEALEHPRRHPWKALIASRSFAPSLLAVCAECAPKPSAPRALAGATLAPRRRSVSGLLPAATRRFGRVETRHDLVITERSVRLSRGSTGWIVHGF